MTNDKPKLIVITGPTASGKSSLAVELALHFGGEIVNADSMQVYRGMDVGTAKPSHGERKGIPHHLIDVVDPDEDFNAALYRSHAIPVVKDIMTRNEICLLVGGTGLYIKTLLGGLLECPPSDPGLRKELYRECEEYGPLFLHQKLKKIDPDSADRIHPHDRTRITRALEIMKLTGRPLSSLSREHGFRNRSFRSLKICLQLDRKRLYDLINQRSLTMIQDGLLNETEALLKKGYSADLKPMKSIGYRHMVKVVHGEWDMEKAVSQLQTDTRRYAKRQLTWFRGDPEMVWKGPEERDVMFGLVKAFYEGQA